MSSQDSGNSALKFLFILLILTMIASIATPWLMRSVRPDGEEAAIQTLRAIHAAQRDHYGATQMYAPMGKLSNSKVPAQSQDSFKSGGYEFTHSTNGSGRVWCAAAAPEQGKTGRTFGIDESGVVYQDLRSASPCWMGTLDKR